MDGALGRRGFVKTALAAAGLPIVSTLASAVAHSKSLSGGPAMKTAYDPAAKFDLKVTEVEFRRAVSGRMLMARVYQPQGVGPFPTLLDLHGGAWNNKDRSANEPMDRAVAASGVLVVAVDLTLAPEAPVPRVRPGRQLRRPLAQIEGRRVERRGGQSRRARQLERRSRRRAPRHASA